MDFSNELTSFFDVAGECQKMVLATSLSGETTARMMSCIIYQNKFYMQTDKTMQKYKQLEGNSLAALCYDNTQILGIASFCGHPLDEKNIFLARGMRNISNNRF